MKDEPLLIAEDGEWLVLSVWIQPRAVRDEIVGVYGGSLKIRICAPALEGRANRRLLQFLGKSLGLSSRDLSLLKGQRSRSKQVAISGLSRDQLLKRINQYIV